MLAPDRILRVTIELIFILLGGLVAWLALRGRILVDRHGKMWLILSIVLILRVNGGRVGKIARVGFPWHC